MVAPQCTANSTQRTRPSLLRVSCITKTQWLSMSRTPTTAGASTNSLGALPRPPSTSCASRPKNTSSRKDSRVTGR
ncbi:hypothetical protein T484DRAFT_1953725 [Baffinella frigidus]|nr:hypothetical protein T484DRAFT_1953725 [Cryptophyta sp. CCMP2293]